jgi:hypothetical protein
MIAKCICNHEYQDQRYGKGNRVHNQTNKLTKIRCTVCENINEQNEPKKEIKK